ncbi:hypothetical protein SLE2022_238810 [Rubroshorea leprosula]
MAEVTPIKIGILGCASIARRVSRAILLASNATLSAIASRSLEKAAEFARANGFPPEAKIYGSYEAMLDDPEIDAVYLPLPTSLHRSWAVRVAQKKKHLLMEKPVALNVAEFDEIVAACDANGVQIMDGTMWIHHPRTHKMKEFLNDVQRFGQLRKVRTAQAVSLFIFTVEFGCLFSFHANPDFLKNNIRVKPDLDGLGALGDLGWYCIRSIVWVADYELPKTVIALQGPVINEAGVILSCGASLHWDDGKVANFHCSFLSSLIMNVTAIGTNGTLCLTDFVIPYQEHEASFTTSIKSGFNDLVTRWEPQPSKHTVTTNIPQEAHMVNEFSILVANIKRNGAKPDRGWPIIRRKTQLVIDAVTASIEKGFEEVEILS